MAIVNFSDLGTIGVIKDQPPHELPLAGLSDAKNVRFKDTNATRIDGEAQILTAPSATPYGLAQYRTTSSNYLISIGTTKVYSNSGTTWSDITGTDLTAASTDRVTVCNNAGVLVFNNGVDKPRYWGGTSNTATLTNWNANWICASMRSHKGFLIALDVTKTGTRYPHMFKWSDAAAPGTLPQWGEGNPAYLAGERDLIEGGYMVDGLEMGSQFIVYKQSAMYSVQYIGGNDIWNTQRIPGESGMLARNCGAQFTGGHIVLTLGDVVANNGQGIQSILSARMRKWLFQRIDTSNYGASFVVANPFFNEVWVCYPESGQATCTQALIWNWRDDTFSIRDLASVTCATNGIFAVADNSGTWSADSNAWDADATLWNDGTTTLSATSVFLGTSAPKVLRADSGPDFDGTAFTARIERTGLDFGDKSRVKLVRNIYPRIEGTTGNTVYIQVGYTMDPEAGYTWTTPISYTIGTTFKADVFASGRLLAYRIYTTDSTAWSIASIDMDVVQQGLY